jgi:hypothetical protein
LEFLLCTLTPEVQCSTFLRNHVIWQTKIILFGRIGNDWKQSYWWQCNIFMTQTSVFLIALLYDFHKSTLSFNVRSSTLKNLNIFSERQISIKLFYLYQRFQCRDNYFFKIKSAFFLYLWLSASCKENDLPLCIYSLYQTDSGVPNTGGALLNLWLC